MNRLAVRLVIIFWAVPQVPMVQYILTQTTTKMAVELYHAIKKYCNLIYGIRLLESWQRLERSTLPMVSFSVNATIKYWIRKSQFSHFINYNLNKYNYCGLCETAIIIFHCNFSLCNYFAYFFSPTCKFFCLLIHHMGKQIVHTITLTSLTHAEVKGHT